MSRIHQINPPSATGKAKEPLDAVQGKLGLVPNMTRAMAKPKSTFLALRHWVKHTKPVTRIKPVM